MSADDLGGGIPGCDSATGAPAPIAELVPLGDLSPGEVVVGHRIVRRLGAGGFGAVYEAIDLALDRPVALKVLQGADPAALERFDAEARLLARIDDPHVVRIYQVARHHTGAPILTMELFGDGPLSKRVRRGQAASPQFAVGTVAQVLRALVAAHEVGVLHRDVKEANILVDDATGLAKLCDFGIARAIDDHADRTGRAIIGTPHYVAPERLDGVRDDPRSDLYAVGVVFFRLLTGRRPFEMPGAGAAAIAQRAATEDVALPPDVPRPLARVCGRLLARDPDLRYGSAHEALEDLVRAWRAEPTGELPAAAQLAHTPAGVPPLSHASAVEVAAPGEATPRPPRRWLLPVAALLTAGAAAALLLRPDPPVSEAAAPPPASDTVRATPPPAPAPAAAPVAAAADAAAPDAGLSPAPDAAPPQPVARRPKRPRPQPATPPVATPATSRTPSRTPAVKHGDPFVVDPERAAR